MNINTLSDSTREYLERRASECGVTAKEILRHFEEIVSGRKVSIHSRLLTGTRKDFD